MYFVFFLYLARKSEIIRSTELLLDAISSNDFESYAYVEFANSHIRVLHFQASLKLNFQKNVLPLRRLKVAILKFSLMYLINNVHVAASEIQLLIPLRPAASSIYL